MHAYCTKLVKASGWSYVLLRTRSGLVVVVDPRVRAAEEPSGMEEVEGIHGEHNHRAVEDVFRVMDRSEMVERSTIE